MASPSTNSTNPAFISTPVSSSSGNPPLTFVGFSSLKDSFSDIESGTDVESSVEDRTEEELTEGFIKGGCDCSGTPKCSDILTKEAIIKCRQECMELTKDELDLVVMSQIRSLRSNPEQLTSRSSHHSSVHSITRGRSEYYLHGVRICRKVFLFLHCMSRSRYERLVNHYEDMGLCTRVHGNSKRLPYNTCSQEEIARLISFVTNFARAHGMPLPGQIPGYRSKVMLLHSDQSKALVYSKYINACQANGWNAIGRRKFYTMWQQLLPYIAVSTPSQYSCLVVSRKMKPPCDIQKLLVHTLQKANLPPLELAVMCGGRRQLDLNFPVPMDFPFSLGGGRMSPRELLA